MTNNQMGRGRICLLSPTFNRRPESEYWCASPVISIRSAPSGAFLLALEKSSFVGCVRLRRLSDTVGEIKRLYVALTARGLGLGEALARGIVGEGKQLKYAQLVPDTLPTMLVARSLYQGPGFKPVAPYRYNPVAGTAFLELQLHKPPQR